MPKLSRADFARLDRLHTELDAALSNWFTYERELKEFRAMIKERRDRASRNRDIVSRANENSVNVGLQDLLDSVREWQTKASVLANAILAKTAFLEAAQDWERVPDTADGQRNGIRSV